VTASRLFTRDCPSIPSFCNLRGSLPAQRTLEGRSRRRLPPSDVFQAVDLETRRHCAVSVTGLCLLPVAISDPSPSPAAVSPAAVSPGRCDLQPTCGALRFFHIGNNPPYLCASFHEIFLPRLPRTIERVDPTYTWDDRKAKQKAYGTIWSSESSRGRRRLAVAQEARHGASVR
jgi:hypothetical protein